MEKPETADGTLIIIVCRAKHLPNRRKMDKQSPYVTMRMGPVANKTPSHFRAGQTPEWTHEVRFQLTRERKPLMKLDVLDETKDEPTPIGAVEIDCSEVFNTPEHRVEGKYIYDRWYELTFAGKRAGLIYLEMTFYPSAPVIPPKLPSQPIGSWLGNQEPHETAVAAPAQDEIYQNISPTHHHHIHEQELMQKNSADEVFVNESPLNRRHHKKKSSYSTEEIGNDDQGHMAKLKKLKAKLTTKKPIGTLFNEGEQDYEMKSSPKIPKELKRSRKFYQLPERSGANPLSVELDDEDYENLQQELAPNPPPHLSGHSYSSQGTGYNSSGAYTSVVDSPPPTPMKDARYTSPTRQSPPKKYSSHSASSSLSRKPPPPLSDSTSSSMLSASLQKLNFGGISTTSIPFSADTIGLEDDEDGNNGYSRSDGLPTQVYMFDKPVKSLSHSGTINPVGKKNVNNKYDAPHADELDPKYYAPTPTEHLSKTLRLQHGNIKKNDVLIDLRTETTGYLGDGEWKHDKFSPSVFDRMPNNLSSDNRKPSVPPKIPKGLLELEYYVLEKENFLKDINGRRS